MAISPSDDSFTWRKSNGEIATAEEIKNNKDIFSQIYKIRPDYPYLFDNYKNIRWEKVPSIVMELIKFFIGEENFNKAQTPKLYDTPRVLFLIVSVTASVFFGINAYPVDSGSRILMRLTCFFGHNCRVVWAVCRLRRFKRDLRAFPMGASTIRVYPLPESTG